MRQDLSTVPSYFFVFLWLEALRNVTYENGKRVLTMSLKSLNSFWVTWQNSYSELLRIIFVVYHSMIILTIYHWNLFLVYVLLKWAPLTLIFNDPSIDSQILSSLCFIESNDLETTYLAEWFDIYAFTFQHHVSILNCPFIWLSKDFYTWRSSTILRFWIGKKYAFILSSEEEHVKGMVRKENSWESSQANVFQAGEHMKVEELEIDSLKTICACVPRGKS